MTSKSQSFFDKIVSTDNLIKANRKALAGKRKNTTATNFNYNLITNILILQKELVNNNYKTRPYRNKVIHEPKTRDIEAPNFRDRVVQHAIHAILSPFYENYFIPDSYACRPKRGTHSATRRVQHFIRNQTRQLYVCSIDISKFYASINHSKLKEILANKIKDEQLLSLLSIVIDSKDSGDKYDELFGPDSHFHTKGRRGIPIGNLTSQLFANIFLHEIDMYAKQQLKIRKYIRYMDDILFFATDKKELVIWKTKIINFLYDELYLTVNPRKVRIYPAKVGVSFVGFIIYPYYMRLRSSSVRRFKKRYRRQLKKMLNNKIGIKTVQMSFNAWAAHAKHAKSQALIENLYSWQDDYLFMKEVKSIYKNDHKHNKNIQLALFDDSLFLE